MKFNQKMKFHPFPGNEFPPTIRIDKSSENIFSCTSTSIYAELLAVEIIIVAMINIFCNEHFPDCYFLAEDTMNGHV